MSSNGSLRFWVEKDKGGEIKRVLKCNWNLEVLAKMLHSLSMTKLKYRD